MIIFKHQGNTYFNTSAADFKRENKNIEFFWKQRPGVGGVAALPSAASQIPGKYLCFLVTRATERQHVDPENLVLSLTRQRLPCGEGGEGTLASNIRPEDDFIQGSCMH